MKLFLISQSQNLGYDTYDSGVVAAPDEETARNMHLSTGHPMTAADWGSSIPDWCSGPEHVHVLYLGVAAQGIAEGVVCASYNAG